VRPSSVHQTVRFAPPQALRDRDNDCLIAKTDERTGIVLSTLQDDKELRLQLTLSASQVSGQPTVKQAGNPAQFLGVILYGPRNRLDDVDAFVRQCRFKLNDPFRCDENVPYMNPQRLSTTYGPLQMTYDLPDFQNESTTAFAGSASNVLEGFETTDLLQEATDPHGLCTALQPYVIILPTKRKLESNHADTSDKRSPSSTGESRVSTRQKTEWVGCARMLEIMAQNKHVPRRGPYGEVGCWQTRWVSGRP
jgi:hypothetical protein